LAQKYTFWSYDPRRDGSVSYEKLTANTVGATIGRPKAKTSGKQKRTGNARPYKMRSKKLISNIIQKFIIQQFT